MKIDVNEEQICVHLEGEIDHHSVKAMREQVDEVVTRIYPKELILDFSGVTFMDSSGIGFVMGRYKLLEPLEGKLMITGLSPSLRRVMKLAGMERLAQIDDGGAKQ